MQEQGGKKVKFVAVEKAQWREVREIYLEAFPKRERKPFPILRWSARRGKVKVLAAVEDGVLQGFTAVIPWRDMVMVDYLAVSGSTRGKGTGSRIMGEVCRQYAGKRVVLLIERLDDRADNREQRIARRRFYYNNGFTSAGIFIQGAGGDMEVLTSGGPVSPEEYLGLQKYALGGLLFRLSGIRVTN